MKQLERIHLCTPYGSPLCPDKIPPHFLPQCASVTLEGIISLEFAKLVINPATIQHLSLDFTPRWMTPILDWISSTSALFSSLTTLALRFPGGNQLMAWQQTKLLLSWKRALTALSGQLVHVIIGSRITDDGYSGRRVCQPTVSSLNTHIFPVFFEENWPHLQKLTLIGANMVKDAVVAHDQLEAVISQVVVICQVDPTDFLWHNHFAYNPNLR
ncbi:hypothetical protein BU17DRAFT_85246 [Hysterangium stoloniferum]|nr:hypothetical protein BU17DRAFT_85246 [Hysterangium stoloniferum]